MSKSITNGTVVYEIKAVNPSAIANFDAGKLTQAIGDDMSTFVGKPMQGLVVKASDAKGVVDKVKKGLEQKKVQQPWLRAGISGADMIFLATDLKNPKYEESCTLVAGYVGLREKYKKEWGLVVNLDKGNSVIDQASKDMGTALKTNAVLPGKAKFGKILGSTPIVLLAHGDEDKTSTGAIYGKDFAGKQPADIVKMLCDNPDEKKCLSPEYSGVIYLDGCFTAQGGAMENYTKQAWDLLKKRVPNVKVKGNLGLAATVGGDEYVTTSEADEKAKVIIAKSNQDFEKAIAVQEKKRGDIWTAKYSKKKDEKGFFADPEVKKLHEQIDVVRKQYASKLDIDLKKIPGYQVKNLVGQFGLHKLN